MGEDRGGLGETGRLLLLTAALLAVAGALCAWGVGTLAPVPAPFHLPLWAVVGIVAATESLMIRLSSRRGSASISLGEAGVVIAMYFAAPVAMVAGWTIGTGIVELVRRRREPWRASLPTLLFTVSYLYLYGCVALLVFRALLPAGHAADLGGWLATAAAMVVATLLGNLLVSAAIMLGGAPRDLAEALRELRFNLATMGVTTSVALAGVTVAWHSPGAALLLLAPAAALALAWRSYARERPRHDTVTLLYETIRQLQDARGADDIVTRLAPRLLATFQAERAEIVLLGPDDRVSAAWAVNGDGGPRPLAPAAAVPAEAVWAPVLAGRAGVLLGRDPEHAARLEAAGLRDAMAAPIPAGHGARGVVLVANASGGLSTFLDEDLRLLETLTSHLGVALENARLVGDLRTQALHDALTGLANRTLLLDRAERALARARRDRRPFAVLLLDLDGFKRVNDSLGHAVGDQLLVTVAERIRASVRANDTPARLGGDEFAVLLDAVGDAEEAVASGARLLDALTAPVQLEGHGVAPAGSIGVAVWDGQATAAEVLRDADAAMYAAKRAGKRRVAVFEPHMHQAALRRLEQEDALRQALDAGALTVMYQPVVALHTGRIVAVEALAHWPRPDGEPWPLERFEALAEEAGLIVPIGLATLEAACRQLRAWQAELGGRAPVLVDVALTPRQAQQPQLAAEVGEALDRSGLAARHLELIVAEGTRLREPGVLANLRALRERDVRLGLGGFGSGTTNLSDLRAVQVDTIKIARAHVHDLGRPGAEALLAHAVVRLCQTLDVQLVADGVNAPEQLDALRQLRCSLGQGPWLVPPVTAEAMTGLLAAGPVHALARLG